MDLSEKTKKELVIVLPSLDPDKKFSAVVDGLVEAGFENIVIVDDGSCDEKQHFFSEAEKYPQTKVLHHGINKGKGRALKDAFAYVLNELPAAKGVITIDGDGQHTIPDIIACGEKMLELGDTVVLGSRDFADPAVPERNGSGNNFTAKMFGLFFGIQIRDTQTGLRSIPRKYLPLFCAIEGERFEYETNMLLIMKKNGIAFYEQPISTVYDPEDYSSHYNALKDSWRIAKIMIKYLTGKRT